MKIPFAQAFLFSLLILSIFVNSCKGQLNTQSPGASVSDQISFTSRQPKLTKTQGSDQGQNVYCGLQDKVGNLWFGTTGEGIFCYDGKLFTQFTEKDGLSSNSVRSILEDRLGNIWFGTNNGVSFYDGKTISVIRLPDNNVSNLFPNIPEKATTITDNVVWCIIQDKNEMIWFGTDKGVYRYDGKTFSHFLNNPEIVNKTGLTLKNVQCMFEDKNGNMWFGSSPMEFEGIVIYDGKTLTSFKPQDEGWIRKITQDKNGAILFSTRHNGLITFDGKTFSDFSQPQELRKDLLNITFVDSKGNIWYGSDYTNDNDLTTGGIWKFDGKSFVAFTKNDGFSNLSAYSFTEDRAGNIWIGTRNTGLYRYDGKVITKFSE
ncbi:MAG: two-component regulator propeller domain-containing protein [Chitinophagales bacterium]